MRVATVPYKDPIKKAKADRAYRERKAMEAGRTICNTAGAQMKIARCENCPKVGSPCRECYNAHRRTYRRRSAGYTAINKPDNRKRTVKKKYKPKKKTFQHRIAVVVKAVDKFLSDEFFSCPGCMRKMRGEWRYCDRCEAKRNV